MMLAFSLYALAAALGGAAVARASSNRGHSSVHAFAHGCVAALYFPFVAAWGVWWAHRETHRALRPTPQARLEAENRKADALLERQFEALDETEAAAEKVRPPNARPPKCDPRASIRAEFVRVRLEPGGVKYDMRVPKGGAA